MTPARHRLRQARRARLASVVAIVTTALPASARPQASGSPTSSSPREPRSAGSMFGQPLYQPAMPAATLTVKVIRETFEQPTVGQRVELHQQTKGGELRRVATATTDAEGRATFAGQLVAGQRYAAVIPLGEDDQRRISSLTFVAPERGGVRLLLSTAGKPPSLPGGNVGEAAPASLPVDGKGQSGAARFEVDRALPAGRVLVKVVKADRAVGGVEVSLQQAAGEPLTQRTDAGGVATFQAQGRSISVAVQHDQLSYSSAPLPRPTAGGLRLTFTVYQQTRDPASLHLGPGTHLIARIGEGRVEFRQVLALVNDANDRLFDPGDGLRLPLAEGAANVEIAAASARALRVDQHRRRILLVGPVPPGQLTLQYSYALRYSGRTLDFRQLLTLPAGQRAMVLVSGAAIDAHGPSIESSQVERVGDSPARVVTLRGSPAGQTVELTLQGLPGHDRRPVLLAIALACLLLLWGVAASLGGARRRREALLESLTTLERRQRGGELTDQRRYHGQRERLLAQLRQLWQPGVEPETPDDRDADAGSGSDRPKATARP